MQPEGDALPGGGGGEGWKHEAQVRRISRTGALTVTTPALLPVGYGSTLPLCAGNVCGRLESEMLAMMGVVFCISFRALAFLAGPCMTHTRPIGSC